MPAAVVGPPSVAFDARTASSIEKQKSLAAPSVKATFTAAMIPVKRKRTGPRWRSAAALAGTPTTTKKRNITSVPSSCAPRTAARRRGNAVARPAMTSGRTRYFCPSVCFTSSGVPGIARTRSAIATETATAPSAIARAEARWASEISFGFQNEAARVLPPSGTAASTASSNGCAKRRRANASPGSATRRAKARAIVTLSATRSPPTSSFEGESAAARATRLTVPPMYVPVMSAAAAATSGTARPRARTATTVPRHVPRALRLKIQNIRPDSRQMRRRSASKRRRAIARGTRWLQTASQTGDSAGTTRRLTPSIPQKRARRTPVTAAAHR